MLGVSREDRLTAGQKRLNVKLSLFEVKPQPM